MKPVEVLAALRQRQYSAGQAELAISRALRDGSYDLSRHQVTWTQETGFLIGPKPWADSEPRVQDQPELALPELALLEPDPDVVAKMRRELLAQLTGAAPPAAGSDNAVLMVQAAGHAEDAARETVCRAQPQYWPDLTRQWDVAEILAAIRIVDAHLDADTSPAYLSNPLANTWRRLTKVMAESGEVWEELSLYTGENPRKGAHPEAREKLLAELGDVAVAALLGIQSQVKDTDMTWQVFLEALDKALGRVPSERPVPAGDPEPEYLHMETPADASAGPGLDGLASDANGRRLP